MIMPVIEILSHDEIEELAAEFLGGSVICIRKNQLKWQPQEGLAWVSVNAREPTYKQFVQWLEKKF